MRPSPTSANGSMMPSTSSKSKTRASKGSSAGTTPARRWKSGPSPSLSTCSRPSTLCRGDAPIAKRSRMWSGVSTSTA
jgi:hypothetical protein